MKHVKPALCAFMTVCLLLCLGACGSPSPEQELAAAQEKLMQTGSLRCDISMELGMSALGESFEIKSSCRADITSEPSALRLDASTDMGSLGSSQYTAYAAPAGGVYSAYIRLPGMWVRQDLSGPEALEQYDVRISSARWLGGLSEVSGVESTQLGGQAARRYDCTVSAQAVDGIMEASDAYSMLSVLGVDEGSAREMLTSLGEIPLSVWIGEQGLPLRYELNLSAVMRAFMDAIAGMTGSSYAAVSIDRLTVSLSLSDFDSVEPITVPPEALGARPLDGSEIF